MIIIVCAESLDEVVLFLLRMFTGIYTLYRQVRCVEIFYQDMDQTLTFAVAAALTVVQFE